MGRRLDLDAFERGAKALLAEGIAVRLDMILGLPGDTLDSIRHGIDYLDRVRPFSELQLFNLSVLPGTAFRAEAAEARLGVPAAAALLRPEDAHLGTSSRCGCCWMRPRKRSASISIPCRRRAWRRSRIGPPPPQAASSISICPCGAARPCWPPSRSAPWPSRSGCGRPISAKRRHDAVRLVERLLTDNPHTSLQVVLEPTGDLRHLTTEVLEGLIVGDIPNAQLSRLVSQPALAAPGGGEALVVLAPLRERSRVGQPWIDMVGEGAALVWWGNRFAQPPLADHEYVIPDRPGAEPISTSGSGK